MTISTASPFYRQQAKDGGSNSAATTLHPSCFGDGRDNRSDAVFNMTAQQRKSLNQGE